MRRNPPSGNGSLCQRHSRNGGCVHPAPPGGTPVRFAATETGAISAKEVVKGTTTAVVVEPSDLFGKKSEVFRDESRSPAGDAIEGLAGEQEIAEQDTQDGGGWQVGPATGQTRHVTVEQAR